MFKTNLSLEKTPFSNIEWLTFPFFGLLETYLGWIMWDNLNRKSLFHNLIQWMPKTNRDIMIHYVYINMLILVWHWCGLFLGWLLFMNMGHRIVMHVQSTSWISPSSAQKPPTSRAPSQAIVQLGNWILYHIIVLGIWPSPNLGILYLYVQ